jgi:hypothetical protein
VKDGAMNLSRQMVTVYLPIIREIRAALELRLDSLDVGNRRSFSLVFLINKHGSRELANAAYIIKSWTHDLNFNIQTPDFQKINDDAKWSELFNVIDSGLRRYGNDAAVIEISLSRSTGRITRKVNESSLIKDFSGDGNKIRIILSIAEGAGFVSSGALKQRVGSKTQKSLTNEIGQINSLLRRALQLPVHENKRFIDGKQGSGYRINPLYNLVLLP